MVIEQIAGHRGKRVPPRPSRDRPRAGRPSRGPLADARGSVRSVAMHADVMVGEGRVRNHARDRRHVTADAAVGRVYRASRAGRHRRQGASARPGSRMAAVLWPGAGRRRVTGVARVAIQAPRLVRGRRGRRVAVRVVARDAIQRILALGVASAPGQGRPHLRFSWSEGGSVAWHLRLQL